MKLKLWTFEFEFNDKDARIMMPIALGLMASKWDVLDNRLTFISLIAYYILYFYFNVIIEKIIRLYQWIKFKCPNCKSRKLILQGYQGYKSDAGQPPISRNIFI